MALLCCPANMASQVTRHAGQVEEDVAEYGIPFTTTFYL
jgi:hypothetical protein